MGIYSVNEEELSKEDQILVEKEKLKRISDEIKRLEGIFKGMSSNTKKVVKSLIRNAAFMSVTLEDLQEHINAKGVTDKYQNGEHQFGVKKSPQVEIHLSMTKNHTQIMKQLADLIPKEQPKQEDDGFDKFLNSK